MSLLKSLDSSLFGLNPYYTGSYSMSETGKFNNSEIMKS